MIVRHIHTPGLSINTYIVFDEKSGNGAVIDPTTATQDIIAAASRENILITDIIETHVHADFLSGAPYLKHALSNAPTIHCSGMGGEEWIPAYVDQIVRDGDEIILGSVRLQAKHTPGHTPEHLAWILYDDSRSKDIPELLFTGDLLFVGSAGRPDLLGEDKEGFLAKQLYCSLFEIVSSLPPHVEIYPAHGQGSPCGKEIGSNLTSTLGYERACNPWLKESPFDVWHQKLMQDTPAIPQYFPLMKKLNVTSLGSRDYHAHIARREVDLEEAISLSQSHVLVDIRPYEVFSEGYIKDSINIPLMPSFPLWAGSVLPIKPEKPILLVGDSIQGCLKALELLQLVGNDRVDTYCNAGLWGWGKTHTEGLMTMPLIDPKELKEHNRYVVVDVRYPSEWNHGHIPDAIHMELSSLPYSFGALPKGKKIVCICRSGTRASIAASFLKKQGYSHVYNAVGGMQRLKY